MEHNKIGACTSRLKSKKIELYRRRSGRDPLADCPPTKRGASSAGDWTVSINPGRSVCDYMNTYPRGGAIPPAVTTGIFRRYRREATRDGDRIRSRGAGAERGVAPASVRANPPRLFAKKENRTDTTGGGMDAEIRQLSAKVWLGQEQVYNTCSLRESSGVQHCAMVSCKFFHCPRGEQQKRVKAKSFPERRDRRK